MVQGCDSFKEWVSEKFKHLSFQAEIPQLRSLGPSAKDITSAVCDFFNAKEKEISRSKRGTENLPLDVALLGTSQLSGDSCARAGKHLGINNYSTVSRAAERIKARKGNDKALQKLKQDRENTLFKPTADLPPHL